MKQEDKRIVNQIVSEKRSEQVEKELEPLREEMRYVKQEMDAANETLRSANDELQRRNEEMIIVNQELLEKQDQLNSSSYYAENMISTIREPLIILDKTLKIKTANASFYKVFNAEEEETEGKLFYEIQDNQWDNEMMRSLLEKILPEKKRLTDFEITLKFPSRGKRTLLLNSLQILNEKKSEKLILLAIEDITERRLVEQKLQTFSDDLETKLLKMY